MRCFAWGFPKKPHLSDRNLWDRLALRMRDLPVVPVNPFKLIVRFEVIGWMMVLSHVPEQSTPPEGHPCEYIGGEFVVIVRTRPHLPITEGDALADTFRLIWPDPVPQCPRENNGITGFCKDLNSPFRIFAFFISIFRERDLMTTGYTHKIPLVGFSQIG